MLDKLSVAMFEERLGSKFRIHGGGDAPLVVELIAATPLRVRFTPTDSPARAPFSLLFRGPKNVYLPQRIYRFEHDEMGTLEIFIVPIGPDAVGMRFEAIFN
jgi:hypothetical protein